MIIHDARERLLTGLPVVERRLTLAGASTVFLEGGSGPPIVLLHGPAANASHWAEVIEPLTATHRVIVPDLPGQGASEPLEPDRVLDWLEALIERTCPEPPVLVGYALGGAIAARCPAALISRLVLVDALGLVPSDPEPAFATAVDAFMAEPTRETHTELWEHCVSDLDALHDRMGDRWDAFAAYNLDRARTPAVMNALGRLMEHFSAPAELDGTGATLIWGREDRATPLHAARELSEQHGWPLHVIEDCAGDPPVEQPEAFVRALRIALLAPETQPTLWNGRIHKRPAFVVRPATTHDVVAAVRYAGEHDLAVSVRGGGHNIAGTALADGGLAIDMSALRTVTVDPFHRTATVEPGCLLRDVDRATQEHGLATPLGFMPEVGVAGLTLGGGLGYLTRRFGWTVDNLLEVEIVTADGVSRRASRDEHRDLFWGVRGAGANLGVVTSFTFRLHPVGPTVHGGLIAWPFERADEILPAYRDLTARAPRELTVWMILLRAPAAPFVPPAWHGRRVCAMAVCFSGDLAGAPAALAPIRALGDPVFDLLGDQPYTELQSMLDGTEPAGMHYDWRTEYLRELGDDFLATYRALAAECPIEDGELGILHLGGALNEHAEDDGAVGNRDLAYVCGALGQWEPGDPRADEHQAWLRAASTRLRPFGTGGSYINFQGADEGSARIRDSYGPNFDRLAALKRRWDPDNRFRSNRNIQPG